MIARSWPTVQLGKHCSKIGSGSTPKGGDSVYSETGVAFIRSQNVYNGFFAAEGLAYLDDDHAEQLAGVTVESGDVLLNITGDSVARCCRVPDDILPARVNQHVSIIRPRPDDFDSRFIGYFLISPFMQDTMLSLAGSGGTRNALTKEMIERFEVPRPPRPLQVRIADILSTYDDLIVNNRRRITLLEDAARLLYAEWFVRLQFPGHEHSRITNGVPEAWERMSIDDLCVVGRGASPRPIASFMGGDVPWFKIGDATASESCFIFKTQEHVTGDGARKSVLLEPGKLILSNSATCGLPYFTAVAGCIHDGWLHFSDLKRISQEFLYCFLCFKRDELVSSVGDGSTQKNLNTAAVGRLSVVLPSSNSLLDHFDQAAKPMFAMVLNLAQQNNSLRVARDLLLPRLLSGQVAV
jgi:type I restriction enzyme S subunit